MEKIKLERIDTSKGAENMAKLITETKTYFLHAPWGAGKSDFLDEVSKVAKNQKFIYLKLWELKDERSVINIAFSQLHWFIYWLIKIVAVASVVISILMTPLVNLGLEQHLASVTLRILGIIALVVAVWQFFKYKSDDFYYFAFQKMPLGNKVLIVDDFDRIDYATQENLYKLFNSLNGKLPIIFAGDINNIARNDHNYLAKIIGSNRIELPQILHPSNIWSSYFDEVEKHLKAPVPERFQRIFVTEKRNLRDKENFNDLLNREFFEHGKLNHVQVEQELAVIYIYLFYPKKYELLRDGKHIEISQQYKEHLEENKKRKSGVEYYNKIFESNKSVDDILSDILDDNNGYPKTFNANRELYLLHESVSNLGIDEAESILNSRLQLEDVIATGGSKYDDFYAYVSSNYSNFNKNIKDDLLDFALDKFQEKVSNSFVEYIIRQKANEIMPPRIFLGDSNGYMQWEVPPERDKPEEEVLEIIYRNWHEILYSRGFDISQEFYFFTKYSILSFHTLGEKFKNLTLESNEYSVSSFPAYYLLTYLSSKNLWNEVNDWSVKIWVKVNDLSDEQYLMFWTALHILDNREGREFDIIPKDKVYIVWKKVRIFEAPDRLLDNSPIIEKLSERLKLLKQEGYNFIYKEEKIND